MRNVSNGPCECGLSYARGHRPLSEAASPRALRVPARPEIRSIRHTPRIGEVQGYPLHVVDERLPIAFRHTLTHSAMAAHRTMPRYSANYDGTITEDNQCLYLLASDLNIVATVVTSLDEWFWKLRWCDVSVERLDTIAQMRRGFKVARVRVAKDYREREITSKLMIEVPRPLPCAVDEVGWEVPFTLGSRKLVRRLRPETLLTCGDPCSLHNTLSIGEDWAVSEGEFARLPPANWRVLPVEFVASGGIVQ